MIALVLLCTNETKYINIYMYNKAVGNLQTANNSYK